MNSLRLRRILPLLVLGIITAGCMPSTLTPTVTEEPIYITATPGFPGPPPAPTITLTATISPTATRTPRPPTPTPVLTATSELLACPPTQPQQAIQPVRLLYANDNRLWWWDEASESNVQLPLPEDAVGPLISPDGRLAVYLTEGQFVDTPQNPLERIPLRVFDVQGYTVRDVTIFSTVETRRLYPDAPMIYLKMEWLPGGHRLLVQVYPYPSGTGILWPTGPLFMVDVDTGESRQILPGGAYERYAVRPDGKQIALLDSNVYMADGTVNWDVESLQQGALLLIDLESGAVTYNTPVRLPSDPWGYTNPVYAPDGSRVAYNSAGGIEIADVTHNGVMLAPLANTCLAENNCYWTDSQPVFWLPDSRSFYSLQSINDYFDSRAEATLSRVYTEQAGAIETIGVVRANPLTIGFSPDRSVLTYWNHPDADSLETGRGDMNWDVLHLMSLQQRQPRQYAAEYVLRLLQWHPDNRHFLYIFSPAGGANPVTTRLALGDICSPPRFLPAAEDMVINQARWLRGNRFLAWALPASGISDRYASRLLLYDVAEGGAPTVIADLIQQQSEPYGIQEQVVVLAE